VGNPHQLSVANHVSDLDFQRSGGWSQPLLPGSRAVGGERQIPLGLETLSEGDGMERGLRVSLKSLKVWLPELFLQPRLATGFPKAKGSDQNQDPFPRVAFKRQVCRTTVWKAC
jgi:hypothetical protein